MKIKSLLLGSLALAGVSGLTAGAQAADLAKGVMTSLDVCDALGLSGLTISSDTDCLQISGGVSYMFAWGDYRAGAGIGDNGMGIVKTGDDTAQIPVAGSATALGAGTATPINGATQATQQDWDSQMVAWLKVVGTADSDFGPARVVIHMQSEQFRHSSNGYGYFDGGDTGGATTNLGLGENSADHPYPASNAKSGTVVFDQAYVSVGDSTILTAGVTGTVANTDDDTPLNYLGLFNASNVAGGGVLWSVQNYAGGSIYPNGIDNSGADIHDGGSSIQVTSSLGNGITLKGGLEDLQDTHPERAGTAVGVISYAGDNLTAHLTVIEAGILDGHPDVTAYHAGFTGSFDKFKVVGAVAGDSSGYFDGLASAQVGLDMFTLAGSVEFTHDAAVNGGAVANPGSPLATTNGLPVGGTPRDTHTVGGDGLNGFGAGLSGTLQVSDGVSLNLGGRYFDTDTATTGNEGYQVSAQLMAAITETISISGEIGVYGEDSGGAGVTGKYETAATAGPPVIYNYHTFSTSGTPAGTWSTVEYGAASLTWKPAGGGFSSAIRGEAYTNGAYRATFNASKTFQ